MNEHEPHKTGRGAQHNPHNRFARHTLVREHEEALDLPEDTDPGKTSFIKVFPKTIVNKVTSPDVGMDYSLNPYQGCEHGCAYCYARVSHQYWGYSAGADFEQKIMVKENAVTLLKAKFESKTWDGKAISLSGNTDCYQPIERKLGITRSLLSTFLAYRNPVGIITKNALILRDLDILRELAALRLVKVAISITTLNEDLRRAMEPRTSTISQRLKTVELLSQNNIPVMVMMAPIIPGLNSHEILPLIKEIAERGALKVGYTMVRLNAEISEVFERWVRASFPDRADKVLNQISETHGGALSDSRFGARMKGEGRIAEMVKSTFEIGRSKYLQDRVMPDFDHSLFFKGGQMQLF